jgi:hypothetical protein
MSIRQRLERLEAALVPVPFRPSPGESQAAAIVRAAVARFGLERLVRESYLQETA